MMKQLRLINCNVTAEHFQCGPCHGVSAGGFSPEYGVLLCQDGFQNKKHMEDTMVHELIHMYDMSKFKMDLTNLKHQACSEVSFRYPKHGNLSHPPYMDVDPCCQSQR
jgi:mitochondrial inner membrane protease ATP23